MSQAISGNVGGSAGSGALVQLVLVSAQGDINQSQICDASGNYTFSNLPDLRTYFLSASLSGKTVRVSHSVTLASADVANVNFQLYAQSASNAPPQSQF